MIISLPQFVVHAAVQWQGLEKSPGDNIADVATIASLESLFVNMVSAIAAITGVALFIMLVVGGFTFLFSAGDQKKLEQAKATITSAIIGLVVIVSAYLLLRTISVFTGVDVTKFSIIQ